MSLRFRRSIKLGKYAKINLGKTGASLSVGVKGAHVTLGKNGVRKTIGIPGTGISYTDYDRYDKVNKTNNNILPQQRNTNVIGNERKITVGDFCPKWLLKWFGVSVVMLILGFIGCATQGMIILFLPVGFISLMICLVIYIVKWVRYGKRLRA